MSKTPKSTFSHQNSYFRSNFFFDQNLDFVLGRNAPPPTPEGIEPTAIPGTYEENPVLIPRKYDSLETSGIMVEVAMPEQTFDIHLEKPEKKRK